MSLYVIHTSPKRIKFVNEYMVPCFKRYGVENIVVWNDEEMEGQLTAWTKCAVWILEQGYKGAWHLEDDVVPCKRFKEISEGLELENRIVQGFITENRFFDFKGKTGIVPVHDLPYGMQCMYIPELYTLGFVYFMKRFVEKGLYRKGQYERGTLYSDDVLRGLLRRECKKDFVNCLDDCMVEHIDYLIGGRSVPKGAKEGNRTARKFDNYEEVERLKEWVRETDYNGKTKNRD